MEIEEVSRSNVWSFKRLNGSLKRSKNPTRSWKSDNDSVPRRGSPATDDFLGVCIYKWRKRSWAPWSVRWLLGKQSLFETWITDRDNLAFIKNSRSSLPSGDWNVGNEQSKVCQTLITWLFPSNLLATLLISGHNDLY